MIQKHVVNDTGQAEQPDFSVITTCYYEEATIERFHAQLHAALESLGRSYEIILVNDGSTDGTFAKIRSIFQQDSHVHVALDLFKNAGQQAAITAGICHARGRAIVLMDSDLQLTPEELPRLVSEYDKGYDVVTGYRKNRQDSLLRTIPSRLANTIMRKASDSTFRDFGCTFKIYNARLVRAFELGPNRIFSNIDLISKAQRCCEVPVSHFPRPHGKSGFTFAKLWRYNTDNLVILSERPFQYLAVICLVLSMLFILRIIGGFVAPFEILSQVTTGMLLNAIVVGLLVTLATLSVLGEFAIRSFLFSRGLPRYIVREIIER
ncbi:MAG: glycosyltransferase family 2 protein [Planctomycetota bacterium]